MPKADAIDKIKGVLVKEGYDEFFVVAGKNALDYANGTVDTSKLLMGGDVKGKMFFRIIPKIVAEQVESE